jgi:starch phosphorylase
MRAVRQFNVVPAIPPSLQALTELAFNLHWTWDRDAKALFERLDPVLWKSTGNDPLRLLGRDHRAAVDGTGRRPVARRRGRSRCRQPARRRRRTPLVPEPHGLAVGPRRVLLAEFGLSETLPQYSGGLGILAGDHLKAASDLGVPLTAIGLLYAEGYFRQSLNADGWQEERYPPLDTHGLALHPTGVQVTSRSPATVQVRAWRVEVGRINLYLLDTAVEGNSPSAAAITDRLYGGDSEHRLRQEMVLGHRRRAGAARPRPRPAGVPHQRRPRRLPVARAHP